MECAQLFPPYTRHRHHIIVIIVHAYRGDDPKRAMAYKGKLSSAIVLSRWRSVLIGVSEHVFRPFRGIVTVTTHTFG